MNEKREGEKQKKTKTRKRGDLKTRESHIMTEKFFRCCGDGCEPLPVGGGEGEFTPAFLVKHIVYINGHPRGVLVGVYSNWQISTPRKFYRSKALTIFLGIYRPRYTRPRKKLYGQQILYKIRFYGNRVMIFTRCFESSTLF